MKYGLAKKICYSAIVLVLLVGLILTVIFGMNGKGYGSVEDISNPENIIPATNASRIVFC